MNTDSTEVLVEPLIGKGISFDEELRRIYRTPQRSLMGLGTPDKIVRWLVHPAQNDIFSIFQGHERVVHLTGMSARVDRWLVRLEGRFDSADFRIAHFCREEWEGTRRSNYVDLMPEEVCPHCGTESTASKDALALGKLRNVLRNDGLLEATRYAWYLLRNR